MGFLIPSNPGGIAGYTLWVFNVRAAVENHNFQVFQIIKNDGTKWAVDTIAMSNNQRVIANQPGNLNRSTAIHQLYPNAW